MGRSTILMLGDSLVDYGNWRKLLPQYTVISRGMPGERAEGLLWRLPSCMDFSPVDAISLMTGTNNLFTGPANFTGTIRTIAQNLQQNYPDAPLMINSLVPFQIPGFQEIIRTINNELDSLASETGACYLDLYAPFEKAREPMFEFDGVHFSPHGYHLWADLLSGELITLLAKESD